MRQIGAIILAAGASRRMGVNKLLLEIDGEALLRRVARLTLQAGLAPVIAVLGHEAKRAGEALAGLEVQSIRNENYAAGMAGSLTAGLAALPGTVEGALIMLADMPFVSVEDVRALCAAFAPEAGRAICIPTHGGRRGNPVLLGRQCFAALAGLAGDAGAKGYIEKNQDIVCEVPAGSGVLADIDTPDAYAALAGGGRHC